LRLSWVGYKLKLNAVNKLLCFLLSFVCFFLALLVANWPVLFLILIGNIVLPIKIYGNEYVSNSRPNTVKLQIVLQIALSTFITCLYK
jgi:hypothetical protein